jgi:site-specific recombinase
MFKKYFSSFLSLFHSLFYNPLVSVLSVFLLNILLGNPFSFFSIIRNNTVRSESRCALTKGVRIDVH